MVKQLRKEYFNTYSWMERANISSGYFINPIFTFMDLDDICKDIEKELSEKSLGAGFVSQVNKIQDYADHRGYLLSYINDVLYEMDDYLEKPLYKGFNNAVDIMATIDMTKGKTDNTIGLKVDVEINAEGVSYGYYSSNMSHLTLEDFIGSRYQETKGNNTYNQKVKGFADLFEEDYEKLVKNGTLEETSLNEYLDSLILKEFAHKKDSPFILELLEQVSELTIVIPIIEAAIGKTLITQDYLTNTESGYKVVSAAVNLVTLGYGAVASKGGLAIAKMFASEIIAEVATDATVIACERAGAPTGVTMALAFMVGTTAGIASNKLFNSGGMKITEGTGDINKSFTDKINNLREQMPNNSLKNKGNMAAADVDIPGIKKEFSAHSKINSPTDKGADINDFSLLKPENDRIFKTYEPASSTLTGTPFDRFHDTEAKILEDIASQITNPNISGSIDLFTELPACQSCTNIIFEFRRKFPNIKLNIFTKD